MKWFNPRVSEFLKEYHDKTLIGLWWAMYWRFLLLVLGAYLALVAIIAVATFIVSVSNNM